jgi:hypothetical protein
LGILLLLDGSFSLTRVSFEFFEHFVYSDDILSPCLYSVRRYDMELNYVMYKADFQGEKVLCQLLVYPIDDDTMLIGTVLIIVRMSL